MPVKPVFPPFVCPEIVDRYREWDRIKHKFMKRQLLGAIVIGTAGVAKSFDFKETDGRYYNQIIYIAGRMTAYAGYRKIRDACIAADNSKPSRQHPPIIIDDVDDFLKDPSKVDLLRQLCSVRDLEHPRLVTYTSRSVGAEGDRFLCKSPVLILGNELPSTLTESQHSIFSRLSAFYFCPDAAEIHRYMKKNWHRDKEVLKWIGRNLDLIQRPDARWYDKIAMRKKWDPKGWRAWALNMFIGLERPTEYTSRADENERVKLQILATISKEKSPVNKHIQIYKERCNERGVTGGSRADFFNVKRRFIQSGGRPIKNRPLRTGTRRKGAAKKTRA